MPHDDEDNASEIKTRDSNGTVLATGDSIFAIKDLKVKGTSLVIKRGTVVKNIRLTSDEGIVAGNTDKIKNLMLETQYFKKA